jgi:hypothetical protein
MSINPRRKRYSKRKFAAYLLILAILGVSSFFLNRFLISRRPLFISPIGKVSIDKTRVEKILKDNKIFFSEVSLLDSFYLVNIKDNGQVRFSQDKNIEEQASSLQKILNQLTIEGKTFKSIDFRFSEPIISF